MRELIGVGSGKAHCMLPKQTDDFIIYKYQRFQTLIQLVPRGEQASPVLYVLVFPVLVSTATPQSVRLYALLSMHT